MMMMVMVTMMVTMMMNVCDDDCCLVMKDILVKEVMSCDVMLLHINLMVQCKSQSVI